jgi:predicted ATP-binding protein involved in virulence
MPDRKTKKAPTRRARKGGRSSPTTGSYFLSLELENVRCFSERQTLDLSDGHGRPAPWTILLGENGTGKTTLLQALAFLDQVIEEFHKVGEQVAHGSTVFLLPPTYGRAFIRGGGEYPSHLKATLESTRNGAWLSHHEVGISLLWGVKYDFSAIEPDPPCCYGYGSARRTGGSYRDGDEGDDPTRTLFHDDVSLGDAEKWLLQFDYSASKPSKIRARLEQRLETFKQVLIDVLPDVSDIRFSVPTEERPTPAVEFKTPYGWVPLRQLGYGYRTTIAWVVDFAARMIERYPDSPDPLAEPAVVLIDEIDLHLHPKWQRELIGFLTERFPNTQFIVTSHSPLVVQAAPDANIALLRREGDHVVIDNDPETLRGWRVDQILTSDLFGLPTTRPPDEEKLLLRRKELLTRPRRTKADEKELDEIERKLGPIPTGESFEQARTIALIKESIDFLKKSQGLKP